MNCVSNNAEEKHGPPAISGGKPTRSKERFLVFGAPVFEPADIENVLDAFDKRWIGTGPKTHQFERQFAEYKGAAQAVALNSCTAALHLSMIACGIGPGDEVITTPMTFCATVNAIIHAGATPVLADCERDTMNISPEAVEKRISPRTKAILVVHFGGRCCDMAPIMDLAGRKGLIVIEDCAHAIESEHRGRKAGRIGHIGCFSFYTTKNITTGEGGMVVTDNEAWISRIKRLALHGMSKDAWSRFSDEGYRHYQVVEVGYKYNMTDIQAAIGIGQLRRIEGYWQRRKAIWHEYGRAFAGLPCFLPAPERPGDRHAYHLYTLLVDTDRIGRQRDWILDALTAENIGVGVHYLPVHYHPYYRKTYGWRKGMFPNAEWIGERTLSLPLSPGLSDADVRDVVTALEKVLTC